MNQRQKDRLSRINQIKSLLVDAQIKGETLNYEKLVYILMDRYGVARRTALEYIELLLNVGFCVKTENEIFIPTEEERESIEKVELDKKKLELNEIIENGQEGIRKQTKKDKTRTL